METILVRLGESLMRELVRTDVRSVELPQHRMTEILQLAAAGLLSSRQRPSRRWQADKWKESGDEPGSVVHKTILVRVRLEAACNAICSSRRRHHPSCAVWSLARWWPVSP
jgi:hypothetical protein